MATSELIMGSERAIALQASIQKELSVKGYSAEDDTVMAEYITIMLINDKTPDQVTSELTELIGDYDPQFTNWLFLEKQNPFVAGGDVATAPAENTASPPVSQTPSQPIPSVLDQGGRHSNRPPGGPRPLYQQAISSLPNQSSSSPSTGQKRQRTPSPTTSNPAKRRQADLPDRPRAMREDGANPNSRPNRSGLLDRLGPRPNGNSDHVQDRIRAVTQQQPGNVHPQMMPQGFPGGMDPATMAMMQQQGFNPSMMGFPAGIEAAMMALQQFGQMAMQMGMVPGAVPMGGQMQPMGNQAGPNNAQNDRGRRQGPARNGQTPGAATVAPTPGRTNGTSTAAPSVTTSPVIVSPTPTHPAPAPPTDIPTRPLSPTLCKFVTNCTNPTCRYSHPSPVATNESGVVLSTDPCEKGLECSDKDCVKAHVSPAAKNPSKVPVTAPAPVASTGLSHIPCKFDGHCTRPNCPYFHSTPKFRAKATPCRFGAACTRADCTFTHPAGRVLPGQSIQASSVSTKPGNREPWNKTVDFRGKAAVGQPKDGAPSKQSTSAVAEGAAESKPASVVEAS